MFLTKKSNRNNLVCEPNTFIYSVDYRLQIANHRFQILILFLNLAHFQKVKITPK